MVVRLLSSQCEMGEAPIWVSSLWESASSFSSSRGFSREVKNQVIHMSRRQLSSLDPAERALCVELALDVTTILDTDGPIDFTVDLTDAQQDIMPAYNLSRRSLLKDPVLAWLQDYYALVGRSFKVFHKDSVVRFHLGILGGDEIQVSQDR